MSDRTCTCYPDEGRPFPCPQKFAASECQHEAALIAAERRGRAAGMREAAEIVKAEQSSGENKDQWTITRDMAFVVMWMAIEARADAIERGDE